jgi:hypothetical protein
MEGDPEPPDARLATRSAGEDNELELNTRESVEKAAAARTRSPLQLPQFDLEPAPAGPTAGKPKTNWLGEGWRGLWVGCACCRPVYK